MPGRTPWGQSEHAAIWLHARDVAGLPGERRFPLVPGDDVEFIPY